MTTNKPEVVAWYTPTTRGTLPVVALNDLSQRGEPLIRLADYQRLQAECEKLVSALRWISYRASGYECRQTPTSDLQRAFADLMRQADDALYGFYNDGVPKQRFCEYAGCCEPAVGEALCATHLEDWREQQAIDTALQEGSP